MVKKSKDLKKSQKITFFQTKKIEEKNLMKKSYSLSFSILGGRYSTIALQSSPFQISGRYYEPDGRRRRRTEEILVSNIGFCG